MQAVAMARNGLALEGELLALSSASHSGENFHGSPPCRCTAATRSSARSAR
jgi:hypothetical protein